MHMLLAHGVGLGGVIILPGIAVIAICFLTGQKAMSFVHASTPQQFRLSPSNLVGLWRIWLVTLQQAYSVFTL